MKEREEEKSLMSEQEVPSILTKHKIFPGDRVLGIIVILFFAISMIVVYSASSKLGFQESGSMTRQLTKHIVTLCFSGIIVLGLYFTNANILRKLTRLGYIGALIITIIPYFQPAINDAHRWINLGFVMFQPSELLKITTIMLLASRLSAMNHMIGKVHLLPTTFNPTKWGGEREHDIIFKEVLPLVMPIALTCMVILPDATSSALHIFLISLVMLAIGGIRWKEIGKFALVSLIAGMLVFLAFGRVDTVWSRLKKRFRTENVAENPKRIPKLDDFTDSQRSQMAILNGGLFGVGAGRSVMRARLTHPESDYLFAIMCEEFGLILSFFIILLYLWIFFRALRIFEKSEWLYAGMLAVGMALLITSQAFLHVGVAIGFLPETGQNLPFLTQGRTGMFCASIAVGIILSISRQAEQGTLLPPSMQNRNRHI